MPLYELRREVLKRIENEELIGNFRWILEEVNRLQDELTNKTRAYR